MHASVHQVRRPFLHGSTIIVGAEGRVFESRRPDYLERFPLILVHNRRRRRSWRSLAA